MATSEPDRKPELRYQMLQAELFAQGIVLTAMLEIGGERNAELLEALKLHKENYVAKLLASAGSDAHIGFIDMFLERWIERVELAVPPQGTAP